uniref:Secretory carrier-associated membrane protein n=1 Tax=Dicentrarchus labrax TaxID=13489 RepID=A0A8P4KU52_DICLA
MSDFDSNPFADPEFSNPFQDPSVTQVRQAAPPGLEEYNPFTDAKTPAGMAPKATAPTINTQPAIMKPTEEPPAYSQTVAQDQSQGASELLRRQEELERKAAELDRREREMQSLSAAGGRKNNWPPLPEKLPVGPCFYHDITVDIPVEFQKTVKIMYYLWMWNEWLRVACSGHMTRACGAVMWLDEVTRSDDCLKFILGRCLLTWWAAWPGSVWTLHVGWTLACPSSGSCSSHRVHSSAGTDRFTEHSGKQHNCIYLDCASKTLHYCVVYVHIMFLSLSLSAGVTAHSGSLCSSSCTSVSLASTSCSASASVAGAPGETQPCVGLYS